MSKGAYVLFIHLPQTRTIEVGRLGVSRFPEGTYLYVGSALNNLEKRVARHKAKRKRLRWHIDYLLQCAEIQEVFTIRTESRIECTLNRMISQTPAVTVAMKGFGSSDCRCVTHLWRAILPRSIEEWHVSINELLTTIGHRLQGIT